MSDWEASSTRGSDSDAFLQPRCSVSTLDVYSVRQAILTALQSEVHHFHGVILDVGWGRMPYKPLLLPRGKYIGLDLAAGSYGNPIWSGTARRFRWTTTPSIVRSPLKCSNIARILRE